MTPITTIEEAIENSQNVFSQKHKPKPIQIENRDQWLQIREGMIGGTDAPALLQHILEAEEASEYVDDSDIDDDTEIDTLEISPYSTRFALWAKHARGYKPNFKSNNRVDAGNRLEEVIAQWAAERLGCELTKATDYYIHPDMPRMGASLDYEVLVHVDGKSLWIPLECKNVSHLERYKWKRNNIPMVPAHIQIQVQHQLEVTGMPFAIIAVLFDGNDLKMFHLDRDEAIGETLHNEVIDFWDCVDNDEEPTPDFDRDLSVLSQIHLNSGTVEDTDWSDNYDILEVTARWQALKSAKSQLDKQSRALKKQIDTQKAELLHIMASEDIKIAALGAVQLVNEKTNRAGYEVKSSSSQDVKIKKIK